MICEGTAEFAVYDQCELLTKTMAWVWVNYVDKGNSFSFLWRMNDNVWFSLFLLLDVARQLGCGYCGWTTFSSIWAYVFNDRIRAWSPNRKTSFLTTPVVGDRLGRGAKPEKQTRCSCIDLSCTFVRNWSAALPYAVGHPLVVLLLERTTGDCGAACAPHLLCLITGGIVDILSYSKA